MNWLAAQFPHLALDLAIRASDLKRELPLAISEPHARGPRILDCNPAAAHHGIRPGLPVNAALGLCEGLHVSERDRDAELAALERLAGWCYQYSSHVAICPERNTLLLEAGASQRLFGAPAELAQRLAAELQQPGYHARTGTGPTPEAAQLAARQGLNIPDAATLATELRELPLDRLYLEAGQQAALDKMGFRTAGDLLRLPRKALARRLGLSVADYLDRLNGTRPDPRPAWRPPEKFRSSLDLQAEVHNSQGLLFPLNRLINELCGVLRGSDRGVQEVHIHLRLRKGTERLRLGLQSPCREEARFMLLLGERLANLRLSQPAQHIRLEAGQFLPFNTHQENLFEPAGSQGSGQAGLLERLQARLGPDAVAGLRGVQDHRPEYSWSLRELHEPPECEPMPHRPVWLLSKPRPCRIHDYQVLAGPERIETGWWEWARLPAGLLRGSRPARFHPLGLPRVQA